ncbi:MAG: Ig-like domain-containing protein [Bacteroidia bacterium]|nr:Ig-like domain-containing protein [Bacteroidia bacterium]
MNKLIRTVGHISVQTFLISFSFLFTGCGPNNTQSTISILWRDNKAIGLSIPHSLVKESENTINKLQIRLIKPGERTAILGKYKIEEEQIVFESAVHLTRGFQYEVLWLDSLLAEIEIPIDESVIAPELLMVYPTQDTVPENLLKIFLHFSQPMVEGQSISHITLLKNGRDTLDGTFLDLQPELWNNESTVLTLWLDPGRIKRDLIPNRELGAPLIANESYTLHISPNWKSKEGKSLLIPYSKTFVTTLRDDESPVIENWNIVAPKSETTEPLEINFLEPLDYSLLNYAIRLADEQQKFIGGTIKLSLEEGRLHFTPNKLWKAGHYTLIIDGRLEDLAGNNLNRPFDRDLKLKEKQNPSKEIFESEFDIR